MSIDGQNNENSVSLVGVHLPAFWSNDPAVWFRLAEIQFETRRITQSYTMFSHVLAVLPAHVVQEARDVIMNPHPTEPYEHLKSTLLKRTTESEQKRLEQLINGEELGDRKPSQLLRRLLQILDGRSMDDALFRQLFLQRLPVFVRSILISREKMPIQDLADLADEIISIPNTPQINSVAQTPPESLTQVLCHQIELLNRNIEKLQVQQRSRSRSYDRTRARFPRQPSPQSINRNYHLCWYHQTFGANARKCIPPCQFKAQNASSENFQAVQ